jgi:hypothetical protein
MELVNLLVEDITLYRVSQSLVESVTLHGILFEKFNSVRDVQYQIMLYKSQSLTHSWS